MSGGHVGEALTIRDYAVDAFEGTCRRAGGELAMWQSENSPFATSLAVIGYDLR